MLYLEVNVLFSISDQRDHTCKYCGKLFSFECRLRAHVDAVHLKLRPHVCELCGNSFPTNSYLQLHIRTVHQGKYGAYVLSYFNCITRRRSIVPITRHR
ncbi:unnamed protein product [Dicrocoelium dendriticum]|nr:unnamed protein product [Dicrocoelium dendriticum]